MPPGQSIKARFKLSFGDCQAVGAPVINRQRLAGYDCQGASGARYWYVGDSNWSTDHWPNLPDHPWVKQTEILKPAITLEKSVDKQEASPGEELLYTIKIKNTGNGGAKNFKLSDSIPAGTALVPGSTTNGGYPWMQNNGGAGGVLEWTSNQAPGYEFPGGAENTVSFKVTVLSTAGAYQAATFKAYIEDRAAGADIFKIWLYDANGNEIYHAEGALKTGNINILNGIKDLCNAVDGKNMSCCSTAPSSLEP